MSPEDGEDEEDEEGALEEGLEELPEDGWDEEVAPLLDGSGSDTAGGGPEGAEEAEEEDGALDGCEADGSSVE